MIPTPEQSAILCAFADTPDNLMLVARAGCGKSATLKLLDATASSPALYLAFNKSVKLEAERSGEFRTTTTIKTLNGLGHNVWASACSRRLALNGKKINEIFRQIADEAPKGERGEIWKEYDQATQGANIARAIGYVPSGHAKADKSIAGWDNICELIDEPPSALARSLIDQILTTSIRWAYDGNIDFADQCYMPAIFGGTYPRFPTVYIDEYQDLSPVQHQMVAKLCSRSRQIGVGDDAQAIYSFRGADDEGMGRAIQAFGMQVLPLSVSFRCPSTIVANVHWRVPDMKSSRDGGTIDAVASISDNSVVICRNNAPLVSAAMRLVAQGHRVDVSGTDISSRVVRILGKLGDEGMRQAAVLSAIEDWESAHSESKSAADTAECMRVFARRGTDLGQAIGYARSLFAQTGTIRFMTGHKAKGLEFDHVHHLDSWLLKGQGQDDNLKYVIDTRARERLSYIDSRSLH